MEVATVQALVVPRVPFVKLPATALKLSLLLLSDATQPDSHFLCC